MRLRRVLALPLLAAWLYAAANTSWADEEKKDDKKADKPVTLDAKTVDTHAYKTLRHIINLGAELYNGGDFQGCYRLYDDALTSFRPLLVNRPNLQKAIDDALTKARTARIEDKAFVLREVIDQIRKETNPNPTTVPPITKTLWDRLGGEKGVTKVIDDFVASAAKDPKVNFDRGGKVTVNVPETKKKLVALISSFSGGPLRYMGKSMKDAHKGMGITKEEFDAAKKHLADALMKNGVKDEDAKLVLDVVEGTRGDIVEGKKPEPPPMVLYDRLGGEKGIAKVVDDFLATASKDPKVNASRGGKFLQDEKDVARAKKLLVEYFTSVVTGDKSKYTGRSMKEVHKGMGITDAEFDAGGKHLVDALKKNGVKDEDVTVIMAVIGGLRKDIVEPKPPEPEPMAKTLWERLGGEVGVARVVDEFVNAAIADPKINFYRDAKPTPAEKAKLKKNLVEWISDQSGGPHKYAGKTMKAAHAALKVSDAEFDATAKLLEMTLKNQKVKEEDAKLLLDKVKATRKDIVEK
jgi:truncated hemoglobin YjbI